MGLFELFKKPKSDEPKYYEERQKREAQKMSVQKQNISQNLEQPQSFDRGFHLTVQDVFTITGRGTVVTGKVEYGRAKVGEKILLQRINGQNDYVTITGIEQFRKMTNVAQAGENVGILLRGLDRKDIAKGDVLLKP